MPQVEIFRSTVFVHEWSSMIHFITDIIEVTHQFEDSKKNKNTSHILIVSRTLIFSYGESLA